MTTYRSYTIEKDNSYFFTGKLMIYPTDQGVQHDSDIDSDGHHYCGNCLWADSEGEAKEKIDDKIAEQMPKSYTVEMNGRLYPVSWLDDAMKFARLWQGNLIAEFKNI